MIAKRYEMNNAATLSQLAFSLAAFDPYCWGIALRVLVDLTQERPPATTPEERIERYGATRYMALTHAAEHDEVTAIVMEIFSSPPSDKNFPSPPDDPQTSASKGFPANPAVPPLYTRTRKAIKHLYKKSSGEKNDVPRTSVDNSTPVDKKLPANPEWTIARDRARELGVWLRWYRNAADTKAEMWGGRMSKWFASMLAYARSAGIGARDAARMIGEQFAALRLRCTREAMEDTKRIELEAHVIAAFATCANAAVVARSASPVNGHTTASRQQASTAYVGRTAAHDPRLTAAALAMIPAKEQTNLGLAAFRSLRATLGYNRNGLPA